MNQGKPVPVSWGVYCRISRDREGAALGVARQEADCRAKVAALGGTVVGVYVDNDVSAYSKARRPEYERLIADVTAGRIGGIVAWHVDRLTRRPAELESIIDMANTHGIALATVTGDIDLTTPQGRMLARQLGSIARYESEHKSERLKSKMTQLADAGQWGGAPRSFGYNKDMTAIVEDEAAVIKDLAARALAGENLSRMARWLNAQGIPATKGGGWSPTTVKRMLTAPRTAGLREHLGVVVGEAAWPAILDVTTHNKLRALLLDPGRNNNGFSGRSPRAYLLTGGLARCGLCGEPLRSRPSSSGQKGYVCDSSRPTTQGNSGCGKIRQNAAMLETYVAQHVLARIAQPEALRALHVALRASDGESGAALVDAIAEDERRLAELGRDYADGLIGRIEFHAARTRMTARLEAARSELTAVARGSMLPGLDVEDVVAWWNDAELEQQRALVELFVEKVLIHKGKQGARVLHEERVEIVWR